MSVVRYTPVDEAGRGAEMAEHVQGDYVEYGEYERLLKRIETLKFQAPADFDPANDYYTMEMTHNGRVYRAVDIRFQDVTR